MNLWSHRVSQNTNKKLSTFLPSLHRAEILTIFCSYFGKNDDFMNPFWNYLTFSIQLWKLIKSGLNFLIRQYPWLSNLPQISCFNLLTFSWILHNQCYHIQHLNLSMSLNLFYEKWEPRLFWDLANKNIIWYCSLNIGLP